MNVKILATCRKLELLPAATLVFKTLRTGFPDAKVTVYINAIPEAVEAIREAAVGCTVIEVETIHHKWIESLVALENEPFFICDTDMVFWKKVDQSNLIGSHIVGTLTPRFRDPFSRCVTMERLHTCLLYINPSLVRKRIARWDLMCPNSVFTPKANLFYPVVMPNPFGNTFYDTLALLYSAIGGTFFTADQIASFDHLHCGTWVDLIESSMPGMNGLHKSVFNDQNAAKGLRSMQNEFYKRNAC